MRLAATIELTNELDFNVLRPIAELIVETNEDLDKFISIANSDTPFEEKYNLISSKKRFSSYEIK